MTVASVTVEKGRVANVTGRERARPRRERGKHEVANAVNVSGDRQRRPSAATVENVRVANVTVENVRVVNVTVANVTGENLLHRGDRARGAVTFRWNASQVVPPVVVHTA